MNSDVTLQVLETALTRQDRVWMCKVPAETVEKCVEIMKNSEPIAPIQGADDNDEDVFCCGCCGSIVGFIVLDKSGIGELRNAYCSECGRKVKWDV